MTATAPTTPSSPCVPLPGSQMPIWLQTLQAVFNPISFLEKTRSQYGDIFAEQ